MFSSDSAAFLPDLEGTEVTLDSPAEPSFSIPRQAWVITEKLSERAMQMRQDDIDDNLGPPFTAAKCLCHRANNPAKVAFMRIYAQIPIVGTEFQKPKGRAKQAAPPCTHAELTALKALKKMRCSVVPDLLGYQEGVQDQDGPVPGGYITHVVWDKVPGEPLRPETFWSLEFPSREKIRAQFRKVYD
ncbi:hypothetical protein PHISP_04678 [Aspergillus sp. HF37]|nr:hypothetical protein PHISP_04678 [Aspergillus sp. HF37]